MINPLPDDKILDWSKLKQSADDNFKFDENSRKFSKRVKNSMGKGEIARYEQFLLFPTVSSKGLFPRGVKRCGNGLTGLLLEVMDEGDVLSLLLPRYGSKIVGKNQIFPHPLNMESKNVLSYLQVFEGDGGVGAGGYRKAAFSSSCYVMFFSR